MIGGSGTSSKNSICLNARMNRTSPVNTRLMTAGLLPRFSSSVSSSAVERNCGLRSDFFAFTRTFSVVSSPTCRARSSTDRTETGRRVFLRGARVAAASDVFSVTLLPGDNGSGLVVASANGDAFVGAAFAPISAAVNLADGE